MTIHASCLSELARVTLAIVSFVSFAATVFLAIAGADRRGGDNSRRATLYRRLALASGFAFAGTYATQINAPIAGSIGLGIVAIALIARALIDQ